MPLKFRIPEFPLRRCGGIFLRTCSRAVDGWYLSQQPFQAAYLRGWDVILGCDWLQSVRPAVFNGRLLSPSIDAVTILGVGHGWFSHPNGSSNARASQVQDDSFATQVLDLYLSVVK
ncbi:hypothetical protein DFH29DRAFT_883641 [Suillus ampliporus]|nr:hypothetical protein DFH29DRAFT_883641 [Suillus ampliporus]